MTIRIPVLFRTAAARPPAIRALMLAALATAATLASGARAAGAQAAAAETLRLGDVYAELRRSSPRVQAASELARAARTRVPSAGLPPDPELQVGWMNRSLPDLAPMEPLGMTQLQLMQMLPLGGKLSLSRGIARERAGAQDQRALEAWWEVRAEAAMAYYEIYRADRALAVMRETLRLLRDISRAAESMYAVGDGRQADVLRAQVELARMSEDTLRMHAMREGMRARLDALLDRAALPAAGLAALPEFPAEVPALDSLEAAAMVARPMIRAGEGEVAAAGKMSRLARLELFPDLQLGVQYGQRGATMTTVDEMGTPMTERRTERMGSLMIGASIPVFARGRQLRQREEAEAMRLMAVADLASMRAATRGALGEAYAELGRARRLAALYRTTILPQAQATVASSLAAYRARQVDFMTLLDAQMAVNRYRQELHAAEADEGRAWAELEMLTGRELLDSNSSVAASVRTDTTGGAR